MLKTFNAQVTQFNGAPWKDEKGEPITVASACVTALLAGFDDERGLTGEDKLKRYILAERIHNGGSGPIEVSSENLTLIKACVAKAWATGVVGFVFQFLEGERAPVPLKAVAES